MIRPGAVDVGESLAQSGPGDAVAAAARGGMEFFCLPGLN